MPDTSKGTHVPSSGAGVGVDGGGVVVATPGSMQSRVWGHDVAADKRKEREIVNVHVAKTQQSRLQHRTRQTQQIQRERIKVRQLRGNACVCTVVLIVVLSGGGRPLQNHIICHQLLHHAAPAGLYARCIHRERLGNSVRTAGFERCRPLGPDVSHECASAGGNYHLRLVWAAFS